MSKEDSREPAPVKSSTSPPTAVAAPPPPKPAAAKPAAGGAKAKGTVPRRSFMSWVTLAWVAFTASMLAAVTATARFMFPNVLFEPPPTFKAGYPNEIQVGQVDERFKQRFAVWLVRTAYDEWGMASGIYALSTVCTHLGCTPNWLEAEQKFKCPCHGSGYYKTGVNFEGPTPRPLERYAISLADDGQILVDKSRKFQEEKGEWNNPAAFLKL
ncbi:MAG TPA: ubiquinol-cytochrome c reductase iron-sulfur subunit [Terriglobia bacterium]|nr:ubiquinol-cytochrome c reductase iron-sulfur subunit [Terriglobia bacterium]